MLFFFFQNLITSFNHTSWLLIEFPGMSVFVLPADELSEEEEAILILTIPVIDNQCNVTCFSEDNTNACLYLYLFMAWWCTLVGYIQDTD